MSKLVYVDPSNYDLEYKSKINIFSDNEIKWLISIKDLFINFDIYIDKSFNKASLVDTFSYVREGSAPAYHQLQDCDALNADYVNYEIPGEIKGKGINHINKYRRIFKENEHLIHSDFELFKKRLSAAFFIRNPKAFDEITRENSGNILFDNIDLESIEKDIDALVEEAENFRDSSSINTKIIEEKGGLYKISEYDHEKRRVLEQWQNLKKEIKNNLINYYTIKYSPDLNFEGYLLEGLGFKKCGHCN